MYLLKYKIVAIMRTNITVKEQTEVQSLRKRFLSLLPKVPFFLLSKPAGGSLQACRVS